MGKPVKDTYTRMKPNTEKKLLTKLLQHWSCRKKSMEGKYVKGAAPHSVTSSSSNSSKASCSLRQQIQNQLLVCFFTYVGQNEGALIVQKRTSQALILLGIFLIWKEPIFERMGSDKWCWCWVISAVSACEPVRRLALQGDCHAECLPLPQSTYRSGVDIIKRGKSGEKGTAEQTRSMSECWQLRGQCCPDFWFGRTQCSSSGLCWVRTCPGFAEEGKNQNSLPPRSHACTLQRSDPALVSWQPEAVPDQGDLPTLYCNMCILHSLFLP